MIPQRFPASQTGRNAVLIGERRPDTVLGMSWAALLPLVLLALMSQPIASAAHAVLISSSPGARAMLSQAPTRVVLKFNERLEPAFSSLSVWDADGLQVDEQDVRVGPEDSRRLSVGLLRLEAGVYTVRFRVLSVDGHVVESSYPFTIRARSGRGTFLDHGRFTGYFVLHASPAGNYRRGRRPGPPGLGCPRLGPYGCIGS